MRRVFSSHREVAHVWAQQKQREGEASHMFFENDTIYSYGRHFPIARFVNFDTVLFTTHRYSVSTAKHISRTHSAIPYKKIFYVDNVRANSKAEHEQNFLKMIESVRSLLDRADRARVNKSWLFEQATKTEDSAFEYAKMFKIRTPRKKITESQDIKTCIETAKTQLAERERREAEKQAKKNAETLKKFRDGEPVGNCRLPDGTIPLRVRQYGEDKGIIETGLGAKVEYREAKLLWIAWQAGKELPNEIGNYHGISLNADRTIITIGCHNIHRDEVAKIFGEVK